MATPYLDRFRTIYLENASMFKKNFENIQEEFGNEWHAEFDLHLERIFGQNDDSYRNAIKGYSRFAIDAMRLQHRFNKTKKYEDVSYDEARQNYYLNDDYMMNLYLPGIFLSHFLWKHHYRQFLFYKDQFIPLLAEIGDKRFYEVGTGTGFYTVQVFRHYRDFRGIGIDISPSSRRFTLNNVSGWGFEDSFTSMDINIIDAELEPFPVIQCVEVLEHLSDPLSFLVHLRRLLQKGGYGFVTAALTAPNADHIYLYWNPSDVIAQLEEADFEVVEYCEEIAFEGGEDELVPKVAAFIVS